MDVKNGLLVAFTVISVLVAQTVHRLYNDPKEVEAIYDRSQDFLDGLFGNDDVIDMHTSMICNSVIEGTTLQQFWEAERSFTPREGQGWIQAFVDGYSVLRMKTLDLSFASAEEYDTSDVSKLARRSLSEDVRSPYFGVNSLFRCEQEMNHDIRRRKKNRKDAWKAINTITSKTPTNPGELIERVMAAYQYTQAMRAEITDEQAPLSEGVSEANVLGYADTGFLARNPTEFAHATSRGGVFSWAGGKGKENSMLHMISYKSMREYGSNSTWELLECKKRSKRDTELCTCGPHLGIMRHVVSMSGPMDTTFYIEPTILSESEPTIDGDSVVGTLFNETSDCEALRRTATIDKQLRQTLNMDTTKLEFIDAPAIRYITLEEDGDDVTVHGSWSVRRLYGFSAYCVQYCIHLAQHMNKYALDRIDTDSEKLL